MVPAKHSIDGAWTQLSNGYSDAPYPYWLEICMESEIDPVHALERWPSPEPVCSASTPTKKWPIIHSVDALGSPESRGTVQSPPKPPVGCLTPSEPVTMLQKQSSDGLPQQHRRSTKTASAANGRPQKVYIFGMLMARVTDRLRESGAADHSCSVTQAENDGHRRDQNCIRYPSFLS